MKKQWIAVVATSAALLVGCGVDNGRNVADDRGIYDSNGNTIDVADDHDRYNSNQQSNEDFGFVRQVKSPVPGQMDTDPIKWMDREQAADNISRMAVGLPNVTDASVVVTDQEVLIAYTIDNKDKDVRFTTADQVKKTAMSAIPRWYHVYVTDDPSLRQDVENIGSMNTTFTSKDSAVRHTVNMMLERSPQGMKMSDGENENGETTGGTNQEMEKTNYRQQWENGKQK